jgi:hypothetical protein
MAADDAALLRCRAIADTGARVACYDAIPVSAAQPARAAASSAAPAAAAAAPAAPALTPEQRFGLADVKKKEVEKAPEDPKFIESTIPGVFGGWSGNQRIKLANGQVWRIIDGSAASLPDRDNTKVRIVRNYFGTMFMEIEGTNQSPKVKRDQ